MIATLRCPHCSNPILLKAQVSPATYGERFKAMSERLKTLQAPFTSREALQVAAEVLGDPYGRWILWDEFRQFGFVSRVRPGLRWVLVDGESHGASVSEPTEASTAKGPRPGTA